MSTQESAKFCSQKLNEEKVREIKRLLEKGEMTGVAIAKMFGVDGSLISQIKTGKAWSWVEINPPKPKKKRTYTNKPLHTAKLTPEQVAVIKRELTGPRTVSSIAEEYGVSDVTISHIRSGITWPEVEPAPPRRPIWDVDETEYQ